MTEQQSIPQALVHMLPHGEPARLAAQILAHAPVIELALADYAESERHGSAERDEASNAANLMLDFRHSLAREAAALTVTPASAPLTGTSARSIVHAIANAVLTMPTPADGLWRQAAHAQVWRTGNHYTQMWKADATYWAYDRKTPTA